MINATKLLGSGNLGTRSGLSYESGELGELAKAFDEMAETLEWRNAQLRESEFERNDALAKIGEVVDCVPEPFFVLDEAFTIRALNREGSLLLEADKDEIIGKSIETFCPHFPTQETTRLMEGRSMDGKPQTTGPQVRRFQTKTKPPRDSSAPVSVDISLTGISIANHPYFLALMKRPQKPESKL